MKQPPPISEVLKGWRKRRKISQQQAAFILNASISAIQKWELGINQPIPMIKDLIRSKCK